MKKILLFLFAITLFEGVLIAQKASKADVARQLVLSGKVKKAAIDINAPQIPEEADVQQMKVTSENYSSKTKLTHLYFQQQINQLPVHNAIMDVHVTDDNQLFSINSRFVKGTGSNTTSAKPSITAEQAVEQAARQLGYDFKEKLVIKQVKGGPTQQVIFEKGSLSQEDIPVSLIWQPVENFLSPTHAVSLKLAWDINIYEPSGNNWWSIRVDAHTGIILDKGNWVVNCNFEHYGYDKANLHNADIPHVHSQKVKGSGIENFLFTGGGTYNVFPQPLESPYDGTRQLIADPADPIASPFGWHDANGVAGAEYTFTLGNNVYAYTDLDANNSPDPGSSPDGGAGLMFDFALDLNNHPSTYRPAAVTNLFYWNNYMHDFSYKYGFDEANGNFQINNYGKGGTGNDPVMAEAQDGSGTNNANFATPPDGMQPRMQMFLWNSSPPPIFNVTSPVGISGNYTSAESGFSANNKLHSVGPVSGEVVYYNDDAGGTSHLACGAPANTLTGKIALIDRGVCGFALKTKNAQNAGAIAVIVVNNAPGAPITMGGTDNTITIPAVMISLSDGAILKAELVNTVNVTLTGFATFVRDSDLDNGLIAHEYAHGISSRLTGGPATTGCLSNQEQMGEGWSDYFALMTTMKPGDVGTTPRGFANYSNGTPASAQGIRPQHYSTDQSFNNSTYNTIKNPAITVPHGVGFVWATMLWDMTWALIDAHGRATGFDEAMNLVMEGMKLQPCSPGFVDGRDAILAADQALYGGANACLIWKAFARRGLGVSASQGSSNDRSDGIAAFDVPDGCPGFSVSAATGNILACPAPSVSPNVQQFTVTGISVPTAVDVNAPANFEVSTNAASGYSSSLSIPSAGGSVPKTIVYVRSSATAPDGEFTGEITVSTAGYAPVTVTVNGFTGAASSAIISLSNNVFIEGFNIAEPLPAGWEKQNLSAPAGSTNWFQGNAAVFAAQSGAANSYIGANFNNITGAGTISNWLFAPNVVLNDGDKFSFWTRSNNVGYPDRLEVRMSTNGTSTDVGASDISTGDFSTLLLSVNPDLSTTGYPGEWTRYSVTISGLGGAVSGRIAFRYFVTNGGPDGTNSDYIGIDNVVYEKTENASCNELLVNLKVDITGGESPYTVEVNVTEQGQPASILTLSNYISGTPIPTLVSNTTVYSIASVTSANGCSGVESSNIFEFEIKEPPLPVITATAPGCPSEPVTLSFSGAIATTPCTNDVFGQWPASAFTFTQCDNANTLELITSEAWPGEYSMVNVEAGKFYGFFSIDGNINYLEDIVTITDETGNTVYSAGVNYTYFMPGFTGKVRFYTHMSGCTAATITRIRAGYCASDIALAEDIFGLEFFSWSPGGATTSSITVNPAVPTNYSLTFRNHDLLKGTLSCEGTSTKAVSFKSNQACGIPSTWYLDKDGDGWGRSNNPIVSINPPRPGYVLLVGDCNDGDNTIFTNAPELCDGKDNDCDGMVDEGLPGTKTWYQDKDGDLRGRTSNTKQSCVQPAGYVDNNNDCNDGDATIYLGAPELCDGKDNDCDGMRDEDCVLLITSNKQNLTGKSVTAQNEKELDATIWPNPTRTELMVTLDAFIPNQKLSLTMMQADGKVQQSISLLPTVKGQQVRLDVSTAAGGFYLLQIKQNGLSVTKRFIVIK